MVRRAAAGALAAAFVACWIVSYYAVEGAYGPSEDSPWAAFHIVYAVSVVSVFLAGGAILAAILAVMAYFVVLDAVTERRGASEASDCTDVCECCRAPP